MLELASQIDHTLLRPDCLESDIVRLCEEAIAYKFFAVCVPPAYVKTASEILLQKAPKVCTVIGFPFGFDTLNTKASACEEAIENGAREIDMVINISSFKSGKIHQLYSEVEHLSHLCHKASTPLKVIIETAYLNKDEIRMVCGISVDAGADFIKTSTGYAPSGATIEDIEFLKEILPAGIKIKASGGIRTSADAKAMLLAGADRLGTSNGVKIIHHDKEPVDNNLSNFY